MRLSHLLVVSCLLPLPTLSQPNTTKINGETKFSTGIVRNLQNGDTACVMVMETEDGSPFTESADFSICSQSPSPVGKRVQLKYKMVNVQAASCKGDPACKKSARIALVVEAKIVGSAPPVSPANLREPSFCAPDEEIIFTCRTASKLVSVCASTDADSKKGYVQYRFGKPGASAKPEMVLPGERMLGARAATGDSVMFSGGGGAWMRFANPPFSYVVYTGIGRWGPKGEPRSKQGAVVERDGKVVARLPCPQDAVSEMGPDWFAKVGIKSGGAEFQFPD